jgi:hypothetical protein
MPEVVKETSVVYYLLLIILLKLPNHSYKNGIGVDEFIGIVDVRTKDNDIKTFHQRCEYGDV